MGFRELKTALRKIDQVFVVDRISEADLVRPGGELAHKIESVQKVETTMERLRSCRSPQQVFSEFSLDVAGAKVDEALNGSTSEARQRAQETILQYALGKPINRSMTMNLSVPDASEEELEYDIRRLLVDLNFAPRSGKTSSILIGVKGVEGSVEATELSAESGVSRELHKEHEEG